MDNAPAAPAPARRRGRPPKGDEASDLNQRQRAFKRERQAELREVALALIIALETPDVPTFKTKYLETKPVSGRLQRALIRALVDDPAKLAFFQRNLR